LNAEIIGIGTELLLGQITNTNARDISAALAAIGVDIHRHTAVGDNLDRIVDAVKEATRRADVVILTGGLGPTPDDITRGAVAAVFGRRLIRDERVVDELREFYERRGRAMPAANVQQADLPEGAVAIPAEGTAPGFYVDEESSLVIAVPGVPWEMRAMLEKTVLPLLEARSGKAVTLSRQVLVAGVGESNVHELIADVVEEQTNPTIAFLAGHGLVRVRVTAKAADERAALALIEPVEARIRDRLGDTAVASAGIDLAVVVGDLARARKATVATAESITGGLIGAELTTAPGASDFFVGALVAYTIAAKRDALGVDEAILERYGPVSQQTAAAMAARAARVFGADLGLSATGVAGPDAHDGHPVGTIYVGASWRGASEARHIRGYGDRGNMRGIAVTAALDLGRRFLERGG
jgi:nicotinamide-nucleotide amidase